jgi:hypothetical protein
MIACCPIAKSRALLHTHTIKANRSLSRQKTGGMPEICWLSRPTAA